MNYSNYIRKIIILIISVISVISIIFALSQVYPASKSITLIQIVRCISTIFEVDVHVLKGTELDDFYKNTNITPEQASFLVEQYVVMHPNCRWSNNGFVYAIVDGKYFFPMEAMSHIRDKHGYWLNPANGNIQYVTDERIAYIPNNAFIFKMKID